MKISYRREMKRNYMILEPEDVCQNTFERRMLASNRIEGLLHFHPGQIDGKDQFYYEITSKQPLSRILENQSIQETQVRGILLDLSRVLDQMERYLLPEGCILLEPEYIYVEPETFRLWLCAVPGIRNCFPEDCGRLMEYLLGKVDHQDRNGVILVYGLYQETRRENYGMEDLLRLLGTDRGREGCESGRAAWDEQKNENQKQEEEPADKTDMLENKIDNMMELAAQPGKNSGSRQNGFWKRIFEWLKERFLGIEEAPIQASWDMILSEEDMEWENRDFGQKSVEQGIKETEKGKNVGQDTVLLADLSGAGANHLHRLRSLNENMEDILLSYYPFIIGKQENLVDYVLDRETVSRLHLKIDRKEDEYYIQDLNSTNGTSVAGHLLINNEIACLRAGDEVCIARYRYRFE